MEITPVIPEDRQVIDSYGPGRFQISQVAHNGPVIVLPDRVIDWAEAPSVESLEADHIRAKLDPTDSVEILLIGTGAKMVRLPNALLSALRDAGMAVDFMETGAACRTYNVLLAEGRLVAAALLPV
jgi:uncharacterized protein